MYLVPYSLQIKAFLQRTTIYIPAKRLLFSVTFPISAAEHTSLNLSCLPVFVHQSFFLHKIWQHYPGFWWHPLIFSPLECVIGRNIVDWGRLLSSVESSTWWNGVPRAGIIKTDLCITGGSQSASWAESNKGGKKATLPLTDFYFILPDK